jgi:hypothetical protein
MTNLDYGCFIGAKSAQVRTTYFNCGMVPFNMGLFNAPDNWEFYPCGHVGIPEMVGGDSMPSLVATSDPCQVIVQLRVSVGRATACVSLHRSPTFWRSICPVCSKLRAFYRAGYALTLSGVRAGAKGQLPVPLVLTAGAAAARAAVIMAVKHATDSGWRFRSKPSSNLLAPSTNQ